MEKTKIERDVEQWFEQRKLGNPDIERERINKNICADEYRMVENRYMPFTGNPKATLVVCNLNPGSTDLTDCRNDNNRPKLGWRYEKCLESDTADDLISLLRNFGDFGAKNFNMKFDRKQLLFLYGFCEIAKVNGVDSGMFFQGENNLDEAGLKEVCMSEVNRYNLFSNRFQLELIPYASNKFEAGKIDHLILEEYFSKLINEVFSVPRNFILLQGNIYISLLDNTEGVVKIGDYKKAMLNQQGIEQYVRIVVFKVTRNDQSCIFIIAPTFQGRIVQSYINMYMYGKFCADKYFEIATPILQGQAHNHK